MNDMFELADKLKELRDKKQHLAEDTKKTMRKLKKRSTSCHWKWQAPKHKVSIVPAHYSIFVQSCMRQLLRRTKQSCMKHSKTRDTVH